MSQIIELPLRSAEGNPYYFERTEAYVSATNSILEVVRRWDRPNPIVEKIIYSDKESIKSIDIPMGIIEEAVGSSSIEGANTTPNRIVSLIKSGLPSKNDSERMALNNYRALIHAIRQIEEPIDEVVMIDFGLHMTAGIMKDGCKAGYRDDNVYVVSGLGEVVYSAPKAQLVRPMMRQLVSYINDTKVHPIERAAVAHYYFVTVHPFFDGNGRSARALSWMILLKCGYEMMIDIPISTIIGKYRSQYYKVLHECQSGQDITSFIEFHTKVLLEAIEHYDQEKEKEAEHRLPVLTN